MHESSGVWKNSHCGPLYRSPKSRFAPYCGWGCCRLDRFAGEMAGAVGLANGFPFNSIKKAGRCRFIGRRSRQMSFLGTFVRTDGDIRTRTPSSPLFFVRTQYLPVMSVGTGRTGSEVQKGALQARCKDFCLRFLSAPLYFFTEFFLYLFPFLNLWVHISLYHPEVFSGSPGLLFIRYRYRYRHFFFLGICSFDRSPL